MRIAYRTDNVPQWGMGAFTPTPIPTPLATTGGTQKRYLFPYTDAPDPMVASYAPGPPYDAIQQGSFAQPSATDGTAGLPGAFLRQISSRHHMAYVTTAENMGPVSWQRVKIFSDNVLPVPAANPGRTPIPAQSQPPWGTVVATPWPRPFITWPTWGTSRQQ